jgi:hypothetical protein
MSKDKPKKPTPSQKRATKAAERKEWSQAEIDDAMAFPKGQEEEIHHGRPPANLDEDLERVEALAASGLTKREIATSLGVVYETLRRTQARNSAFSAAIDRGRARAIQTVENSLYKKANGYSHPEDKIFYDNQIGKVVVQPTIKHYPPDTQAALAILQRIESGSWKPKTEITLIDPIAEKLQKARERAKRG